MGVPNYTRDVDYSRGGVVSCDGSLSAFALPLKNRERCNADLARGDGNENGMRPDTGQVGNSGNGACLGESHGVAEVARDRTDGRGPEDVRTSFQFEDTCTSVTSVEGHQFVFTDTIFAGNVSDIRVLCRGDVKGTTRGRHI